ncbi:MAG: hypothetical protein ACTSWY_05920 [Promethearchaeota archaeon]
MTDAEIQTKNWLLLSVELIGVTLTILTLMWTLQTLIPIVSYLLLISFIIFINAVTTNSKYIYEATKGSEQEVLRRWELFAEYSFGIGFTLLICSFAITSYAVLGEDIIAPTLFLGAAWLIMLIYNALNEKTKGNVKKLAAFRNFKRDFWLFIEVAVLILLYLDKFGILSWIDPII